jgi:hypothetical protein
MPWTAMLLGPAMLGPAMMSSMLVQGLVQGLAPY